MSVWSRATALRMYFLRKYAWLKTVNNDRANFTLFVFVIVINVNGMEKIRLIDWLWLHVGLPNLGDMSLACELLSVRLAARGLEKERRGKMINCKFDFSFQHADTFIGSVRPMLQKIIQFQLKSSSAIATREQVEAETHTHQLKWVRAWSELTV